MTDGLITPDLPDRDDLFRASDALAGTHPDLALKLKDLGYCWDDLANLALVGNAMRLGKEPIVVSQTKRGSELAFYANPSAYMSRYAAHLTHVMLQK